MLAYNALPGPLVGIPSAPQLSLCFYPQFDCFEQYNPTIPALAAI